MANSYWNFAPLEKKHDRSLFDCGNEELNNYLKRYARDKTISWASIKLLLLSSQIRP